MKRTEYRGYIIDKDNMGRTYIYNTESPYSEDCDKIFIAAETLKYAKAIIDCRIRFNADVRY